MENKKNINIQEANKIKVVFDGLKKMKDVLQDSEFVDSYVSQNTSCEYVNHPKSDEYFTWDGECALVRDESRKYVIEGCDDILNVDMAGEEDYLAKEGKVDYDNMTLVDFDAIDSDISLYEGILDGGEDEVDL